MTEHSDVCTAERLKTPPGERAALCICGRRPVSDPSETLALIAEHRLILIPFEDGSWAALEGWDLERDQYVEVGFPPDSNAPSYGPTIGDAVRACVARIKER